MAPFPLRRQEVGHLAIVEKGLSLISKVARQRFAPFQKPRTRQGRNPCPWLYTGGVQYGCHLRGAP